MFDIPEMVNLAHQMNANLKDRVIKAGSLGNSFHKFICYNREYGEFEALIKGKTIGEARTR